MTETISVIIPVYKAEKTIKTCLDSLLNQTYPYLEVLVVLLKSEDNTQDIINTYSDSRLKIILQKEENGPGGARNIGINKASGQWLGFLEADDTISSDFYEKLLKAAQFEKADIACCPISVNKKMWENYATQTSYFYLKEKYELIQNGATFNKLFSRNLIEKHNIRFSESKRWEDNIFIFKSFYYAKKIITIPFATYYYNPSVWSKDYKNKLKQDIVPVTEEIMHFFQTVKITNPELNIAKHKIFRMYAQSFIEDREIYKQLMKLMGKPLFLRISHYKKRFKTFKRRFLHKKRKEKL